VKCSAVCRRHRDRVGPHPQSLGAWALCRPHLSRPTLVSDSVSTSQTLNDTSLPTNIDWSIYAKAQ
jgi:hypothetical protein